MGSNCHVCGYWNSVSELLGNFYGETIKKFVQPLMRQLADAGKRQNDDLRDLITGIERRIERALERGVAWSLPTRLPNS